MLKILKLIFDDLMTTDFLYDFMRQHKFGVLSTISPDNIPESAYVGIAFTKDLKIIFDTVSDSRKYRNLLLNPNLSFVIDWDHERTVQYEGIARIPKPDDLDNLLITYFDVFPDGKFRKKNWPNIAYFCVEPKWIRYSDFNIQTQKKEELRF
jgi:general stress protein 26